MLTFSAHPATITISAGIQDAWRYLAATWKSWLPVVFVVAGINFVFYVFAASWVRSVDPNSILVTNPITGRYEFTSNWFSAFAPLIPGLIFVELVAVVAGWVIMGIAIRGLRQNTITASWVVIRGLLSLAASLLLALTLIGVFVLLGIASILMPVFFLGFLIAVPAFIYVAVRLAFVGLAVFDGFGPIAAIRESWRLSSSSWWRLLGWGVVAWILTVAIGWIGGIVALPFSGGIAPVGSGLESGFTLVATCLSTFLLAVLYESQRARLDPSLYGPVPTYGYGPGYPGGPAGWPGYPPGGGGEPSYPYQSGQQPGAWPPPTQQPGAWPPPTQPQPGAWPPPTQQPGAWPPPTQQPGAWPPPTQQPGTWSPPTQQQPGSWPPPTQQPGAWPQPGQPGSWPAPYPPQPDTAPPPAGETPPSSGETTGNQAKPDQPSGQG